MLYKTINDSTTKMHLNIFSKVKPLAILCYFFFILACFGSCVSPKQIVYFQSNDTTTIVKLPKITPEISRIQANDILSITVGSLSTESNEILNFANINALTTSSFPGQAGANQGRQPLGYLVDITGFVELPFAGKINVLNLTLEEASQKIRNEIEKSLKNPAINIRFLNHKFSILGEVNHPATYNLVNDQTTLPEALAMAGDLTIYGERSNVLIIREKNGVRELSRINLLNRDVLNSPYYYIKNGDVIYIEPSKAKATYTDRSIQLVPVITSITTTILVLLNFILK